MKYQRAPCRTPNDSTGPPGKIYIYIIRTYLTGGLDRSLAGGVLFNMRPHPSITSPIIASVLSMDPSASCSPNPATLIESGTSLCTVPASRRKVITRGVPAVERIEICACRISFTQGMGDTPLFQERRLCAVRIQAFLVWVFRSAIDVALTNAAAHRASIQDIV